MSTVVPTPAVSASVPAAASGGAPALSDRRLVRVQAISGLAFATFLVLHLANAAAALAGQAAYDAFMAAMRWYYQFPAVEIAVVIGAAVVHVAAGIVRIRRRRANRRARGDGAASAAPRPKRPSLRVRVHRLTGYFLMVAFTGHVLATRGVVLLGHVADFSYINFSLVSFGWWFYPYYTLLAFCGLYHLSHGVIAALRVVRVRVPARLASPRSRGFWLWAAAAFVLAVVAVLALAGNLFAVDQARFPEWRALYARLAG